MGRYEPFDFLLELEPHARAGTGQFSFSLIDGSLFNIGPTLDLGFAFFESWHELINAALCREYRMRRMRDDERKPQWSNATGRTMHDLQINKSLRQCENTVAGISLVVFKGTCEAAWSQAVFAIAFDRLRLMFLSGCLGSALPHAIFRQTHCAMWR